MFDCIPDSSHEENMPQAMRYIYVCEEKVRIEESFVDLVCQLKF